MKNVKQILQHKVVGIVGAVSSGKTTALIDMINSVQKYNTNVVAYFFHEEYHRTVSGVNQWIRSPEELIDVHDSFIFIDEFKTLFNLEDRHNRKIVEQVFAMLLHNNNIVVLCGLPDYYNQFMSKLVRCWALKSLKFSECINGSDLKKFAVRQCGEFNGGLGLNVPIDKILVNGQFESVEYVARQDKKANNVDLFSLKPRNKGLNKKQD
jgi:hypothetical protein